MLNESEVSDTGQPAVLLLLGALFIDYRVLPESGKGFLMGHGGPPRTISRYTCLVFSAITDPHSLELNVQMLILPSIRYDSL